MQRKNVAVMCRVLGGSTLLALVGCSANSSDADTSAAAVQQAQGAEEALASVLSDPSTLESAGAPIATVQGASGHWQIYGLPTTDDPLVLEAEVAQYVAVEDKGALLLFDATTGGVAAALPPNQELSATTADLVNGTWTQAGEASAAGSPAGLRTQATIPGLSTGIKVGVKYIVQQGAEVLDKVGTKWTLRGIATATATASQAAGASRSGTAQAADSLQSVIKSLMAILTKGEGKVATTGGAGGKIVGKQLLPGMAQAQADALTHVARGSVAIGEAGEQLLQNSGHTVWCLSCGERELGVIAKVVGSKSKGALVEVGVGPASPKNGTARIALRAALANVLPNFRTITALAHTEIDEVAAFLRGYAGAELDDVVVTRGMLASEAAAARARSYVIGLGKTIDGKDLDLVALYPAIRGAVLSVKHGHPAPTIYVVVDVASGVQAVVKERIRQLLTMIQSDQRVRLDPGAIPINIVTAPAQ